MNYSMNENDWMNGMMNEEWLNEYEWLLNE